MKKIIDWHEKIHNHMKKIIILICFKVRTKPKNLANSNVLFFEHLAYKLQLIDKYQSIKMKHVMFKEEIWISH